MTEWPATCRKAQAALLCNAPFGETPLLHVAHLSVEEAQHCTAWNVSYTVYIEFIPYGLLIGREG